MPMVSFLKLAPEEHLPHIPDPAVQRSQSLVSQEADGGNAAIINDNNEPITPLTPAGGFLELIPERGAPWSGQSAEKEVVVAGRGMEGNAEGKKISWEKREEGKIVMGKGKEEEKGKGAFAKLRRAFSVKRG